MQTTLGCHSPCIIVAGVRIRRLLLTSLVFVWVTLTGCATLTSTPTVTADASQSWALLPIANLSENPQADRQARSLLETRLRTRGVDELASYAPVKAVSLRQLLDPDSQQQQALQWARQSGYRYGLSGTINEWNYRSGADREPVVGINLKLLDIHTGDVLWQGSAARTGWGFSNLPALGDAVIAQLLESIRFDNTSR
ncbi:hypothetical protein ACUNV4_23315 [Granulosicoccus sp. 3-233]|uniref:hypothetical protein n=1 Tax=Granulosicoccus sp. 3-233 TaxID=3417969 RepID=UPI003D335E04